MIQSKIKLCAFLFKSNDPKAKVLIDTNGNLPELVVSSTDTIRSLLEHFCKTRRLPIPVEDFKLVDCQINNEILEICYYIILPFGYTDPGHNLIDAIDLDITSLPNLEKTIRLL